MPSMYSIPDTPKTHFQSSAEAVAQGPPPPLVQSKIFLFDNFIFAVPIAPFPALTNLSRNTKVKLAPRMTSWDSSICQDRDRQPPSIIMLEN
ncbi:hypothetical protein ACHAWO_011738 [Cyclotella atomus]|uniref:Uncharacterized protein n=1 Tax=Cyclotella atomus TaxID=382360 RepID=A0ABD3MSG0_9STRA